MVHDLNPKNLHTNGLIFFVKSKKNPIFRVFLGIILKIPARPGF